VGVESLVTFPVQDIAPNRTVGVAGIDIIPSLQANSYSFGWWLGFEVFQVRGFTPQLLLDKLIRCWC
jgi:RimJ/RimL family protein N-acetyltransferase